MGILENILQSWQNLVTNKMRAFLSILGLVIGVFSVTVMVSVGEGLKDQVLGEFDESSKKTLTLIAGTSFNPFNTTRNADLPGFSDSDIAFFQESMSFIKKITPVTELTDPFYIKGQQIGGIRIVAGSPDYMDIESFDVIEGRKLNNDDLNNYQNVVLVSENIVKDFLETTNKEAIGQEVLISDQYFTIIGITEDRGGGFISAKTAIIPITTGRQKITGDPFYPYLVFELNDDIATPEAVKLVKYTVLKWQGASHMDDALFQVLSTEELLEQISNITNLLQLALGGIGLISLLVGGIGVMNIMLVSVTERTREVGIRKAIGAKYKDILLQFLIESILLGLLGCVIGVLLSAGVIFILQKFSVPALLNFNTLVIAVVFSLATGIIFGVGPARKAARMKPIDALRFE